MLGFFVAFAVKLPVVAAAHLAARRPHRGAHRRQRDPGRPAASRSAPTGCCASWCRSSRRPSSTSAPSAMVLGRDRHPLRRRAGLRPDRPQAAGGLHQREPHGLRAARHLRLERRWPCRAWCCRSSATASAPARSSSWSARCRSASTRATWTRWAGSGASPRAWAASALFFALASLGLPGLGNFVAEFLILLGTWQVSRWAAVLGAVGLVFATVYSLWLMQRAFQGRGDARPAASPTWLPRETGMFAAMIAALVRARLLPAAADHDRAADRRRAVQQITAASPLPPAADRRGPGDRPVDGATRGRRAMTAGDLIALLPLLVAHRGAGGRHARRRLLPLARRSRWRSRWSAWRRRSSRCSSPPPQTPPPGHAAAAPRPLRPLLSSASSPWPRPPSRCSRGATCERRARAPRGVLRAPAHRHARRRGARRQHPLRLVLPRPRDPQRLALRAHRLPASTGAVRRGGGQVPGARRRHLGLPRCSAWRWSTPRPGRWPPAGSRRSLSAGLGGRRRRWSPSASC